MYSVCSFCKKKIRCFLICDNQCGKCWCSDECADKDQNHDCGKSVFNRK